MVSRKKSISKNDIDISALINKIKKIEVKTEEEEAEDFLKKIRNHNGNSSKSILKINSIKPSRTTKKVFTRDKSLQTLLDKAWDNSNSKKSNYDENIEKMLSNIKRMNIK